MLDEVSCDSCSNRVLVEKYSPEHTSIQWIDPDSSACRVFAQQRDCADGSPGKVQRTCSMLRATIDRLADAGTIPISSRSYPTPGRIH
ncbi:hypothetical protein VZC37_04935 [Gordonia sp. LSe1-13]|uniref:Ferredoxin n=1 Tax=Gordonia sesuvii TaxID=3116777 RepID=A0ABU7M977_9ACTN|nr:hypothetical protein [Gordonia sp. LSe1-13]